jgi:hypothetical protein
MRLRLQFIGTEVLGGGSDSAGNSEIRGALAADGTVTFNKAYASHTVHYEGHWDGLMIAGTWTLRHIILFGSARFLEETGVFEIWPEVEEGQSIAKLMDEEEVRVLTA